MILNPDLYEDLSHEFLCLLSKSPKFLVKFILSGSQSLIAARQILGKVTTVELTYDSIDPLGIFPPVFIYVMKFGEVSWLITALCITLEYRKMRLLSPRTLNFLIRCPLSDGEYFPPRQLYSIPRKLFLRKSQPGFSIVRVSFMWFRFIKTFSDLKRLTFKQYNLSTAKQLLKSRKFEFVKIDYDLFRELKDVIIDTEEIESEQIPLNDILKCKFIKAKSWICKDFFDQFNTNVRAIVK